MATDNNATPELNLEAVQKFFESNADQPELKEFKQKLISPDLVEGFLESEDGKKILQPRLDKHFSKGLETWKQNNLNSILEEEISKRFPEETPEQKKLRQLQEELENFKKQNAMATVKTEAMKELTNKGLPLEVADFLVDEDLEATKERIQLFSDHFNKAVKSEVENRLKSLGGTPRNEGGKQPSGKVTKQDLMSMDYEERSAFYQQNPDEYHRIMRG